MPHSQTENTQHGLLILPEDKCEMIAKEEADTAETIASIMLRSYDGKGYGEDDTSQPTSRAAPLVPQEPTRKKKKRKRCVYESPFSDCWCHNFLYIFFFI